MKILKDTNYHSEKLEETDEYEYDEELFEERENEREYEREYEKGTIFTKYIFYYSHLQLY
jgi:hypothetical protein